MAASRPCLPPPSRTKCTLRMTFPFWQQHSAPADMTVTLLCLQMHLPVCVCGWMDSIQPRYAYENVLSFDNEKDSKNQRNNWLMEPRWTDKRIMKCAECMWFVNSAGCVGKKVEQNCPVITNTRTINWFKAFNAEMQDHCDLKLYVYLNKTNARNKPCYILARA